MRSWEGNDKKGESKTSAGLERTFDFRLVAVRFDSCVYHPTLWQQSLRFGVMTTRQQEKNRFSDGVFEAFE